MQNYSVTTGVSIRAEDQGFSSSESVYLTVHASTEDFAKYCFIPNSTKDGSRSGSDVC